MPDTLPLFPLQTVLFPGMVLPLHIFEPRYRKLFSERAEHDPIFGIVLTRIGREVGDQPEIYEVGTGATLLKAVRLADGRVDLAVRGGNRFRILDGHWDEGYLTASVEWLPADESAVSNANAARLPKLVQGAFFDYLDALERTAGVQFDRSDLVGDLASQAYAVCTMMPFAVAERQRLLEADPPGQLQETLLSLLRRDKDLLLATGIGGTAIDHPGRGFSAN